MNEGCPHPLWRVLDHQGRTLAWLATKTEYSQSHIWAMKGGRFGPSPEFRRRAAAALDLPESVLFHDGAAPSESAPAAGTSDVGSDGRARTAVSSERTEPTQEVAIGISA